MHGQKNIKLRNPFLGYG